MKNSVLINGDCFEILNKLVKHGIKVDSFVTDPPYGMSYVSNMRKVKHKEIECDDELWWLNGFMDVIYDLSKDDTSHYMFCSRHNIDVFKVAIEERKFKIKNLMIWDKGQNSMGDLQASYGSQTEFIWYFSRGRRIMNGKRNGNILRFKRMKNDIHPTQKPVGLMEYLISKNTDEGDIVVDPFMGSGTTGIACRNLNRKFIGIEKDKEYFKIATERINKTEK